MALAPSPNFFIIGAQRSATRWLRFNLDRHPEITIPPMLPKWFDPEREGRLDSRWYRHHFDPYFDEPFVGEAHPSYMAWKNHPTEFARRISVSRPEARLLAIVRDPVERFLSAIGDDVRRGRLARPAQGALTKEMWEVGHVSASIYYESLRPFSERFGDQLLVLFYEDVCSQPEEVYAAAVAHIGADPGFRPPDLAKVRYPGSADYRFELTHEERVALFAWYDIDVGRLEEWTGRDLSHWRPSAAEN